MPTDRRRAAARRRAWGRGPVILRFEPLEGRQLLSTTTTTAQPDLVPVALDTASNLTWGSSFHVKGTVSNQGSAAASSAFVVNIYASPSSTLGPGSVLLGQATVPAGLLAGGQASYDQVVSLPSRPLTGATSTGTVYIETLINPDGEVTESNTSNNSGAGLGHDTSVVTVTPAAPSSLSGVGLSVSPTQLQWGQSIQVTAQLINNSTSDAPATRARVVLTPSTDAPGGSTDVTIGNIDVPPLPAGQAATMTQSFLLPGYPPAALLNSTSFTLSIVQDADYLTNPVYPHKAVNGLGGDMASISIAAPSTPLNVSRPNLTATNVVVGSSTISVGQTFQVTATLQNTGKLDAGPFRVRYLLVGPDGSTASAIFLADTTVAGLKVGGAQTLVQNLQLPADLGNYLTSTNASGARIAVVVDPEHSLDLANPGKTTAVSNGVKLQLVATDGTTSAVTATTTAATAANATISAAKTAAAAKKAAAAAAANARKKFGPKAPTHTLEHNLSVFPRRVSDFFTNLFHPKKPAAKKKY